jgi:hypothetical protein
VLQFQSVQMAENPYSSPYLSTTTHEASYWNNMNVPNWKQKKVTLQHWDFPPSLLQ